MRSLNQIRVKHQQQQQLLIELKTKQEEERQFMKNKIFKGRENQKQAIKKSVVTKIQSNKTKAS